MVITLNRPEAMNAINGALSHGLLEAVRELDADDGLTAGVITGAGRGFCSGMDLKAFSRGEDIGPLSTFIREGAKKPLIAAVEGFAIAGGCEIALTCDLLVASKECQDWCSRSEGWFVRCGRRCVPYRHASGTRELWRWH